MEFGVGLDVTQLAVAPANRAVHVLLACDFCVALDAGLARLEFVRSDARWILAFDT